MLQRTYRILRKDNQVDPNKEAYSLIDKQCCREQETNLQSPVRQRDPILEGLILDNSCLGCCGFF